MQHIVMHSCSIIGKTISHFVKDHLFNTKKWEIEHRMINDGKNLNGKKNDHLLCYILDGWQLSDI